MSIITTMKRIFMARYLCSITIIYWFGFSAAEKSLRLFNRERQLTNWPGNEIPFYIDKAYTKEQVRIIRLAIVRVMADVDMCVKFIDVLPTSPRYKLKITPFNGDSTLTQKVGRFCHGYAGKLVKGGGRSKYEQDLVLSYGPEGCFDGTIHTLMKYFAITMGKRNEHQGSTRDKYLQMRLENIEPEMSHAYRMYTEKEVLQEHCAYDYCSITHNQPTDLAKPGKVVFTVKNPPFFIPKLERLSGCDCTEIKLAYGCDVSSCKSFDCAKEASASKPDPAKAPENAHIANVIAGKANVSATAEDAEIAHLIDEMAEVPPAAGSGDVKHFTNRTEQPSRENKVCFATPLSGDVTVTFTATIPAALQPPPTATAVTASEICSVSVKSAKSPAAKSSVVHDSGGVFRAINHGRGRAKRTLNADSDFVKWSDNTVSYYIDPAYTASQQTRIKSAISIVQSDLGGCIKFREVSPLSPTYKIKITPTEYPSLQTGGGCRTFPGVFQEYLASTDHEQRLVLTPGGQGCLDDSIGNIMKYFVLVLGRRNEHQRPDRDQYIQVHEKNIPAVWKHAYEKYKPGFDVTALQYPYDYCSITHNEMDDFSMPGSQAFSIKNPQLTRIKRLDRLSEFDCKIIASAYACPNVRCPSYPCTDIGTSAILSAPGSVPRPSIAEPQQDPSRMGPAANPGRPSNSQTFPATVALTPGIILIPTETVTNNGGTTICFWIPSSHLTTKLTVITQIPATGLGNSTATVTCGSSPEAPSIVPVKPTTRPEIKPQPSKATNPPRPLVITPVAQIKDVTTTAPVTLSQPPSSAAPTIRAAPPSTILSTTKALPLDTSTTKTGTAPPAVTTSVAAKPGKNQIAQLLEQLEQLANSLMKKTTLSKVAQTRPPQLPGLTHPHGSVTKPRSPSLSQLQYLLQQLADDIIKKQPVTTQAPVVPHQPDTIADILVTRSPLPLSTTPSQTSLALTAGATVEKAEDTTAADTTTTNVIATTPYITNFGAPKPTQAPVARLLDMLQQLADKIMKEPTRSPKDPSVTTRSRPTRLPGWTRPHGSVTKPKQPSLQDLLQHLAEDIIKKSPTTKQSMLREVSTTPSTSTTALVVAPARNRPSGVAGLLDMLQQLADKIVKEPTRSPKDPSATTRSRPTRLPGWTRPYGSVTKPKQPSLQDLLQHLADDIIKKSPTTKQSMLREVSTTPSSSTTALVIAPARNRPSGVAGLLDMLQQLANKIVKEPTRSPKDPSATTRTRPTRLPGWTRPYGSVTKPKQPSLQDLLQHLADDIIKKIPITKQSILREVSTTPSSSTTAFAVAPAENLPLADSSGYGAGMSRVFHKITTEVVPWNASLSIPGIQSLTSKDPLAVSSTPDKQGNLPADSGAATNTYDVSPVKPQVSGVEGNPSEKPMAPSVTQGNTLIKPEDPPRKPVDPLPKPGDTPGTAADSPNKPGDTPGKPTEITGKPGNPPSQPENPSNKPVDAPSKPADAAAKPEDSLAKPEAALPKPETGDKPRDTPAKPSFDGTLVTHPNESPALSVPENVPNKPGDTPGKPGDLLGRPEDPAIQPGKPSDKPGNPQNKPADPANKPDEPPVKPEAQPGKPEDTFANPLDAGTQALPPDYMKLPAPGPAGNPPITPDKPASKPGDSPGKPVDTPGKPANPASNPEGPGAKPEVSPAKPDTGNKPDDKHAKPVAEGAPASPSKPSAPGTAENAPDKPGTPAVKPGDPSKPLNVPAKPANLPEKPPTPEKPVEKPAKPPSPNQPVKPLAAANSSPGKPKPGHPANQPGKPPIANKPTNSNGKPEKPLRLDALQSQLSSAIEKLEAKLPHHKPPKPGGPHVSTKKPGSQLNQLQNLLENLAADLGGLTPKPVLDSKGKAVTQPPPKKPSPEFQQLSKILHGLMEEFKPSKKPKPTHSNAKVTKPTPKATVKSSTTKKKTPPLSKPIKKTNLGVDIPGIPQTAQTTTAH